MVEVVRKSPIVWPNTDEYPQTDAAHAEWEQIVTEYETNPGDMYTSWLYLGHHPLFWNTRVFRDGERVIRILDFHSAWNRPECLELNLERNRDTTTVVLDVVPVAWDDDPGVEYVGLTIYGTTHAEVIINGAKSVHDKYGNDREYVTDDDGRWYG